MAASFIGELLGRRAKSPHFPNISDKDSTTSVEVSEYILEALGLPEPGFTPSSSPGTSLEHSVSKDLQNELPKRDPSRAWDVRHKQNALNSFSQYSHLRDLTRAIDSDESGTLRVVVGGDYLITPDVTVRRGEEGSPLHASVSCKWTLRSDRAQNARTEARGLIQHRKGRAPHIVVVTAEPLPSRLASLGFGTGDIDALYHIAYPELLEGVEQYGTDGEKQNLDVMVRGNRLRDYTDLAGLFVSE